MTIFKFKCYRSFLQSHLDTYLKSSPRKSLRSYAKHLSVSPSRLSEVLAGKGNFSVRTAIRVADFVAKTKTEKDYFLNLHELHVAKSQDKKNEVLSKLNKMKADYLLAEVDLDNLDAKDWFHYTILFLLSVNPSISIEDISAAINISEEMVETALNDLRKAGYINLDQNEQIVVNGFLKVEGGTPSKAVREFHRAMIAKSLHAMNSVPIEQRHFWTHIFTMDKNRYQRVVDIVSKALAEVSIEDNGSQSQEVYCIATQLFPVSKLEKKESSHF